MTCLVLSYLVPFNLELFPDVLATVFCYTPTNPPEPRKLHLLVTLMFHIDHTGCFSIGANYIQMLEELRADQFTNYQAILDFTPDE